MKPFVSYRHASVWLRANSTGPTTVLIDVLGSKYSSTKSVGYSHTSPKR